MRAFFEMAVSYLRRVPTRTSKLFRIYCGDCVEGMQEHVETGAIDVVVTSPPYNLGIKYNKYEDHVADAEYLDWCDSWVYQIGRCLKPDGSFFLNVGSPSANSPFFAFDVARRVGKALSLQNTIHWIKSISLPLPDGEWLSRGHFKPINSPRYINDCQEYIFHFTKSGTTKLDKKGVGVPYQDKSNIRRWGHTNGEDKRCRGNTWFIPYKTINRRDLDRPHPATFPAELAEKCIRLHGKARCAVLDPFLGIGNAAIGACDTKMVREFIGFDIDDYYLRVACEELGCTFKPI